jgi:hypothetical protein
MLSSDPQLGASNVTPDGSSFTVNFSEPLAIPKTALNVEVSMVEATVWWTVANVRSGVNSRIYINDDGKDDYVVDVPTGLYGHAELNAALLRDLANQGAPPGLLSIGRDGPTGKVILQFAREGTTVDFTPIDTPRAILGSTVRSWAPPTRRQWAG